MYWTAENRAKLIIACMLTALSSLSFIASKTLATSLILTSYSTNVLPYFYFSEAALTIMASMLAGQYQQNHPKKFPLIFNGVYLCILLIFVVSLQWAGWAIFFIISILVLTFNVINVIMSWSYLSNIYDVQEYKGLSKVFQSVSTVGAICSGVLTGCLSINFSPTRLLLLLFIVGLVELFLIARLNQYLYLFKPINKAHLKFGATMKQNAIFKYFAFFSIFAIISTTLIDYNLKVTLAQSVTKQQIASVMSIIYVISTTGILIVQLFCLDYLFHLLGSKKLILIFPIGILIAAVPVLIHYNLITMAILFIMGEILTPTIINLSRNLYLNILPLSVRNLSGMTLKGIVNSMAIIFASGVIYCLSNVHGKMTISLILIIICCCCSFYIAKILTKKYRQQLIQSLYLRRFSSDLINMTEVDNKDVEDLLKQALDNPDPEANLFGLQLLARDHSLPLSSELLPLLKGDNPKSVKEIAKLLVNRCKNNSFYEAAQIAFKKSNDFETQWYLILYMIERGSESLLPWLSELLKTKTPSSLAMTCLVYLKQGDLDQQMMAMKSLLAMHHSREIEQRKWFLYLLKETTLVQKEKYLIQYIEMNIPELRNLALQQIEKKPSPDILDMLATLLGEHNNSPVVTHCIVEIGDPIVQRVTDKLKSSTGYAVKIACVRVLSLIRGSKSERSLLDALQCFDDVVIKTDIAKYIAYRGIKIKISNRGKTLLADLIKTETNVYYSLLAKLNTFNHLSIRNEINSRLQFIKTRVLYYSAAVIGSIDILNSVSLLMGFHSDKSQQAFALELIDATAENREISSLLLALFVANKIPDVPDQPIDDPWLNQFIHDIEGNTMDSVYTFTKLRKVSLFKELAAETLQVLVQCCFIKDMAKGEVIFSEGDMGDGLYIVDTGEVSITKNGLLIATLSESEYFGELALLSDTPRFATATANSEGALLYIDKQDFDRITDEIPEIMKSINKQVIKYLIRNASLMI